MIAPLFGIAVSPVLAAVTVLGVSLEAVKQMLAKDGFADPSERLAAATAASNATHIN